MRSWTGRSRSRPVRGAALLLGASVLGLSLPVPGTLAAWTDTASATSTSTSLALTAPTLTCATTGQASSSSAVVTWQASSSPTLLTYTALIVENGARPTVSSNGQSRSVTVPPSLMTNLANTTATLRITGALAGTAWTVSKDQKLTVGTLGLSVACA